MSKYAVFHIICIVDHLNRYNKAKALQLAPTIVIFIGQRFRNKLDRLLAAILYAELFISRSTLFSYLSPQCLQCHNRSRSHSGQTRPLKQFPRLFITRSLQAKHTVDRSHKIRTSFHHGLECIVPRYTRTIHAIL